jgi:hypothetical protein
MEDQRMFVIDEWSKEHLHEVSRELLFSLNYMWFLMEGWVKENCPEKIADESFIQLNEDFGTYEAARLQRVVKTEKQGIDLIVEFLKRSHWAAFEDLELKKISDTELRMRTKNCTAQKASKKWGMEYYECGKMGLLLRGSFFKKIDPRARVARVFTPPDSRPEGTPEEISCEWSITLEQ